MSDQEANTHFDAEELSRITIRKGAHSQQHKHAYTTDDEDPVLHSFRRKLRNIADDLEEIHAASLAARENRVNVAIFKAMFKSAKGLYDRFTSLFEELCDALDPPDPPDADINLRRRIKSLYYESCMIADEFENPSTALNQSLTLNSSSTLRRPKPNIPSITLPPFDGQRDKWQYYKDTFQSLILNDSDLSQMDKFYYLIHSLQGSAHALIARIPFTEANFSIAWQELIDTYDNQRLIATAYLDQLLGMKPLTCKPWLPFAR